MSTIVIRLKYLLKIIIRLVMRVSGVFYILLVIIVRFNYLKKKKLRVNYDMNTCALCTVCRSFCSKTPGKGGRDDVIKKPKKRASK